MAQRTIEEVRQKYLKLAESQGSDQAISAIHAEIADLEAKTFEGGYDVERLRYVEALRALARELFNFRLLKASQKLNPTKEER